MGRFEWSGFENRYLKDNYIDHFVARVDDTLKIARFDLYDDDHLVDTITIHYSGIATIDEIKADVEEVFRE